MLSYIRPQHIYWDKKSIQFISTGALPPKEKAKIASVAVAGVYRFFELTGRLSRANPDCRVDITIQHLENFRPNKLKKDVGCILFMKPEIISESEIIFKRNDPQNGFKEIARLCNAKWQEIQIKCQSPKVKKRTTTEKQREIIQSFFKPKEVSRVLSDLGL